MVRNDPDLKSLTEEELRLSAGEGDSKTPGKSDITRVVHSGETILGDVFEGRPGEFVFSKVTPTIRRLGDGRNVVDIKVNTYAMSFDGKEHKLFTNYPDDSVHVVNAGQVSISHPTPEGAYQTGFVVKVNDAGDSVRLRAISEHHYFKHQ